MASFAARMLAAANRLFPAPALPGDVDPLAYARWEYGTSDAAIELWRRAAPTASAQALDLGCGLGGKTHRLAEVAGHDVVWSALDIDVEHLRGASSYHREVGLERVAKIAGDAGRLPFVDRCFDRILSADALEHLPDPRRALLEMRRCLRDDGRLLLLFNPWGSPRGSHLGDLLHLPWCQMIASRESLIEATLAVGEQRARSAASPTLAAREQDHARALAHHFEHHVHPTRIADLRRWLQQDRTFTIESELHVGPGPLRRSGLVRIRALEEWLSATYGAVLRPVAT